MPDTWVPPNTVTFGHGQSLTFGPFTVTPILVDHSAFDAYALLVEAGGQRLLYSGDLRAHGRKGALFERLVRSPPRAIDALLMEGSSLGRLDAERLFPTESEIEDRFVTRFGEMSGLALVAASAQNIDRVVSLYRACKRTDRTLILDLYAAEILAATGHPSIPQSDWRAWRSSSRTTSACASSAPAASTCSRGTATSGSTRSTSRRSRPGGGAVPHSLLPDLDRAGCLAGAEAIWSQWDGYLRQPRGQALAADLAARDIPLTHAHTSGHASIPDLKRLVAAIAPRRLVPIHTFEPQRSQRCSAQRRHQGGRTVVGHDGMSETNPIGPWASRSSRRSKPSRPRRMAAGGPTSSPTPDLLLAGARPLAQRLLSAARRCSGSPRRARASRLRRT